MHTPSFQPPAHKKLPHTEVLGGIKNRISELLDSEAFLPQSEKLERLFTQLDDALDAKINKAGYDYKDYEQRLFREEDKLEAIVQQDQALRVLYENLLQAIEFAPYLKHTLWDRLLFDRVLELGPPPKVSTSVTFSFDEFKTNPEIPSSLKIKNLPSDASIQELEEVFLKIENAPGVLSIDLTDNNLGTFRKDQLQATFSHLGNVRSIDLSRNLFGELDESRLNTIFSHMGSVRSLNLRNNDLCQLDELRLQAIFSHLGNVRSIDVSGNDLGNLDEPRLHEIFSHLGNVKNMDLIGNDLGNLDEPRLHAIFSHLGNAISLNLNWNDLGNLDEPRLHAIFSHLGNVRSIDLGGNDLWQLDEPRLHAIFSRLVHIEEVILVSQEERSMLESLFPNLIGKIKIV